MKTLVKSALAALTVGLFAIPVSAENIVESPLNVQDTIIEQDTIVKEEPCKTVQLAQAEVVYTKIEVSEVPEAVVKAAAEKYAGYAIEEAAKGTDNSYRLTIKNEESTLSVYFTEDGVFLKEEGAEVEEEVMLV